MQTISYRLMSPNESQKQTKKSAMKREKKINACTELACYCWCPCVYLICLPCVCYAEKKYREKNASLWMVMFAPRGVLKNIEEDQKAIQILMDTFDIKPSKQRMV